MQPHTLATSRPHRKPTLTIMFEEDFERCFICQQPCKGLYCSSECRVQDKGTASPAVKASGVPGVRLTTQLPATLSPLHRPQLGPSPRMPAHVPSRGPDSSSSSSIASSPIHSPRTNPSGIDSPQKEPLDLPPPAFPTHHASLVFPGSVPVKIPRHSIKSSPSTTPTATHGPGSHSASLFPIGNSIDTLRYGRKPGVVNSVTSPNALAARCACGKAAGHARRASSKERVESGLANLSLGPSLVAPIPQHGRVTSNPIKKTSHTGHNTPHRHPAHSADIEHHTVSSTLGTSLLSRSRSDPIPSSPKEHRMSLIAPMTRPDGPLRETVPAPASGHGRSGRGRSLERQPHHLEMAQAGVLNQSREREQAPSRSRHRRDERPERRLNQDTTCMPPRPVYANAADGWSRRPSYTADQIGEGIVPAGRRPGQGGDTSPRGRAGYGLRTGDL